MTMKMLSLIQKINSEVIPPGQAFSNARVEVQQYAVQLFERLSRGKDSSKLNDYQDHEAAAEALTYLLWQAINKGV